MTNEFFCSKCSCDYFWWSSDCKLEYHQDIVLNSSDPFHIFIFARDWIGSDKDLLFKAILKTKDYYYINKFLKEINISEDLKQLVAFI